MLRQWLLTDLHIDYKVTRDTVQRHTIVATVALIQVKIMQTVNLIFVIHVQPHGTPQK